MKELTERITQIDSSEIESLLKAVLKRYHVLFPDWEVFTVSLEKSADRNEQIDKIIDILQKMKTSP